VAFDLKVFFAVVAKDPVAVAAVDVFEFLAHQREDRTVVRLADREPGLSAQTIARRLSSVSGLYGYLIARADTPVQVSPVPRGLPARHRGGAARSRVAPLVRVPRTLRRCGVLGLGFERVQIAGRRLVVVGPGGPSPGGFGLRACSSAHSAPACMTSGWIARTSGLTRGG
jgi:hypothetical protein